ncbi:hypothetical protein Aperf_G00000037180 [Anoplocephala perfoliata]
MKKRNKQQAVEFDSISSFWLLGTKMQISTISLISTISSPRDGSVLIQALSRHHDHIESACDKILERCCTESKSNDHLEATAPRVLDERAREVLARYLIELLSSLVLPEPFPQTIRDVDARLAEGQLCFPDKFMPSRIELEELRTLAEKGKKSFTASLDLPVEKIFSALKETAGRFNHPTCIYITAVTERVISNFLKFVIDFEELAQFKRVISAGTIQNMFRICRFKSERRQHDVMATNDLPQDYNKCVNELVTFVSSSLEQLNLILRIFREPVLHSAACTSASDTTLVGDEVDETVVTEVFRMALDLYNNFRLLLDYLESDCVDDLPFVTSTSPPPTGEQSRQQSPEESTENRRLVGRLLIEFAEDLCIDSCMNTPEPLENFWRLAECPDVLDSLAKSSRSIVHTLTRMKPIASDPMEPRLYCLHALCCPSCRAWDQKEGSAKAVNSPAYNCNSVVNSFRYLLPRLLLLPVFQFFQFYRLAKALHEQSIDRTDQEHIETVLEYLLRPRFWIRSILTRYPDLHVQLARLLSTGHLLTGTAGLIPQTVPPPSSSSTGGVSAQHYRSYSASPATTAVSMTPPIRRDSSAQHQYRLRCHTPPLPHSPPQNLLPQTLQPSTATLMAVFSTVGACGSCAVSLFNMDMHSSNAPSPMVGGSSSTAITSSSGLTEEKAEEHMGSMISSLLATGVCAAVTQAKLEELERLTGGKDRLLSTASSSLGRYVMEGRLLVQEEGKRTASERQAYLFTNCLLLCKRVERRGTGLASSAMVVNVAVGGQSTPLRVKRRVPLEGGGVHIIDATPYLPIRPSSRISGLEHASLLISAATSASLSRGTISDSTHRLHATLEEAEQCSFTLELFDTDQRQLSGDTGTGDGSSVNIAGIGSASSNSTGLEVPQGVLFHHIHFEAPTPEEKADWMASLLSITTSRVYERYLRTLPKLEIPLRLPPPNKYRFAQPDTPDVIVFEPPSTNQASNPTSASTSTTANRLFQSSLANRVRSASTTASVDEPLDSFDELGDEGDDDIDLLPTSPTDDESLGGVQETDDLATLPLPAFTSSRILSPHLGSQNLPTTSPPAAPFPVATHRPQILYATMLKLIEHLTHPAYFDPPAVNVFLMYYRRFITATELFSLLEERYKVPNPDFRPDERENAVEDMKRRFRSAYKRRVQERVLAFLLRWTRSSRFYACDFAPNPELRERLAGFLAEVRVRMLLPAVQAIGHALIRGGGVTIDLTSIATNNTIDSTNESTRQCPAPLKLTECGNIHQHRASLTPPLSPNSCSIIDLLQIHPLELAEQVTSYEFELYRRINFWEVSGQDQSEEDSPNITAHKTFSNQFRNWLVHSIVAERNFEDRVVAIQRVFDLMYIFDYLSNEQGHFEARGALISSSVFRLAKALEAVGRARPYRKWVQKLRRETRNPSLIAMKASRSMDEGSARGASANLTPFLPFFPFRVSTRLIHMELQSPDRVTPTGSPIDAKNSQDEGLINFGKLRQLADVVEGFLKYQSVPYTFPTDKRLQQALISTVEAFNMNSSELDAQMCELSAMYEPRIDTPSELQQPAPDVERRLSKEAIQAANYLTTLSLKDKLQHDLIATYKNYFIPRQMSKSSGVGTRISSPRLSSPPSIPPPSPPPLPPPPTQSSTTLGAAEQRVVSLWTTRLRQHRAGQQIQQQLQGGAGYQRPLFGHGGIHLSPPRPLSSPTAAAVSSSGVVHHHSVSDSQMESLTNGRLPSCTTSASGDDLHIHHHIPSPPIISPLSSPPPPPPPPRRQSSGAPFSSPASASHSPSPLFPFSTALIHASLASVPISEASADGGLPPLPPKPAQRTPSGATAVAGLSPSAVPSSSAPSRQFSESVHQENLTSTPPLPPRRQMS